MTALSGRERRALAGSARTLHERLAGPANESLDGDPDSSPVSDPDPDAVVAAWRERLPADTTLDDRLAELGLDEAALRRHVRQTAWPTSAPMPAWVDQLDGLVERVTGETPPLPGAATVADDLPFGPVLAAVAAAATAALPDRVDRDVIVPAVEWLLDRLSSLCARPLYVEFRSFVAHRDPELAEAEPDAVAEPPTDHYEAFVERMSGDAFPNLCLEYPFLGRLLATVTEQFRSVTTTLVDRIDADRAELSERFGVDGELVSVTPLAHDTHAGGAVPFRVTFETGEVVYKPRSTEIATTLYGVLDRLGERSDCPRLRTPTVWSRDGYGWVSHHDSEPVTDEAAIRQYYRRAGCLIAVGYLLGLTDCHHENVVSEGAHPVAVDVETALSPAVPPEASPLPTTLARFVGDSVLSTALVPADRATRHDDGPGIDALVAGLAAGAADHSLDTGNELQFRAVNTDLMRVAERGDAADRGDDTPSVSDRPHQPSAYVDDLTTGFERGYDALVDAAGGTVTETATDDTGIDGLATLLSGADEDTRGRLVFRPTRQYAALRHETVGIDPLSDGVQASVVWETLRGPFVDGDAEIDQFHRLCRAERTALRRFDVPRLTVPVGGGAVWHDGESTGVSVDSSSFDRVRRRITAASPADRRRQVSLIRRAFAAPSSPSPPSPASSPVPSATGSVREGYYAAARRAFERVRAHCRGDDGRWEWIASYSNQGRLTLDPGGRRLYHGVTGLAVAAAALARVHDDERGERYRSDVRELLAPVVESVETGVEFPSGGHSGVGGIVYGLTVVADLLEAPRYRTVATRAATAIDSTTVADDDAFDVVHGVAGTALGLAAHYERTGDERVLASAVDCADQLRAAATRQSTGVAWRAESGSLQTGFSHGSSGIACALARVGGLADTDRHRQTAREAVAFEATQFDHDRLNWRRQTRESVYPDRWCHGRSGILLSRREIADRLGETPGVADLTSVTNRVAADLPSARDHLCCGTFGRVEALLAASDGGDRWHAAAQRLLSAPLARREQTGAFELEAGHTRRDPNPTLFDGLAGVTYVCLRAAAPTKLPCVVRFD